MLGRVVSRSLVVLALCYRAKTRNSLTTLGIYAAILTAIVHSITSSSIYLSLLVAFYVMGSAATKYKANAKKDLTVTMGKSGSEGGEGPRNHIQVFANSITASLLILALQLSTALGSSSLNHLIIVAIISQYSAATADTLSSEVGILSQSQPILITSMKPCPKGTNGGISLLGLKAAACGGAAIGLLSTLFNPLSSSFGGKIGFVVFQTALGVFGSLLDSLLGALFQNSYVNKDGKIVEQGGGVKFKDESREFKVYSGVSGVLSNNQVNLAMTSVTALVGSIIWMILGV